MDRVVCIDGDRIVFGLAEGLASGQSDVGRGPESLELLVGEVLDRGFAESKYPGGIWRAVGIKCIVVRDIFRLAPAGVGVVRAGGAVVLDSLCDGEFLSRVESGRVDSPPVSDLGQFCRSAELFYLGSKLRIELNFLEIGARFEGGGMSLIA